MMVKRFIDDGIEKANNIKYASLRGTSINKH